MPDLARAPEVFARSPSPLVGSAVVDCHESAVGDSCTSWLLTDSGQLEYSRVRPPTFETEVLRSMLASDAAAEAQEAITALAALGAQVTPHIR